MHNPASPIETSVSGPGSNSVKASHVAPQSTIAREFHNFLADIEELIKDSTSLSGEDLIRARSKLNARIATAKASAEEMGESIVQRARQGARETNDYVHEQPWKTLAVGTAIAFLAGLALARRG